MSDGVPARCPTCGGNATAYHSPDRDGTGHVYCDEDDCGWIHRHVTAVDRYTAQDANA